MTVQVLGVPETLAKFAELAAAVERAEDPAQLAVSEEVALIAQTLVAVDTGETLESIEASAEGVTAGGAAPYLEFGTSRMGAQPFMRPAADSASGKGGEVVMRTAVEGAARL